MNLCAFFASICAPELTLGKVSAHEFMRIFCIYLCTWVNLR